MIEKSLGKKAKIKGQPSHAADIKDGALHAEMAEQTWADITKAGRLLGACRDFGLTVPELTAATFLEPGRIVRIGVPPLRLEVMNEISGVSFEECYARRIEETIDGVRISFIDREKLLMNKRAAGRPMDLADIEALTRPAKDQGGKQ